MADSRNIRRYIAIETTAELKEAYLRKDARYLLDALCDDPARRQGIRIVGRPSFDWQLDVEGVDGAPDDPPRLVVALEAPDLDRLDAFVECIDAGALVLHSHSDLPFAVARHWCPAGPPGNFFGTRAQAERLTEVDALRPGGPRGEGVNVVLVDDGLERACFPGNFAGGWRRGAHRPGAGDDTHGTMVARNVAAVAPAVRLFDMPLIPPRITRIETFLSHAQAAFIRMAVDIAWLSRQPKWKGPWILVNAWAIFDRASEQPKGEYTNNPDHLFNLLVTALVQGGIDCVFAAGNCGRFCPDSRCGRRDRGPYHSIWGANALEGVLTVGAVRTDGLWIGRSSEGPGPSNLAHDKPDITAPSQFRETKDAHLGNGGTSAACGFAAGVLALLRESSPSSQRSPAVMYQILRDSACRPQDTGWDGRYGYGIVNARQAYDRVKQPPSGAA